MGIEAGDMVCAFGYYEVVIAKKLDPLGVVLGDGVVLHYNAKEGIWTDENDMDSRLVVLPRVSGGN